MQNSGSGLIQAVIGVVERAGTLIRQQRIEGIVPEEKPHGAGPVTSADRAADEFLHRELLRLAPGGWLSEERVDDQRRLRESRIWIVDPLDGTIEFVQGLPEYAISVALVENGLPILAVIHNPATDDCFWAERGAGAFRNCRAIRVQESTRLLASRTEFTRGEFAPLTAAWDIRPVGSTAYKMALVAAGDAAATFSRGPKWEWDVCAGALLVEEAGGVATQVFDGSLRFNAPDPKVQGILAAAPGAWERIRNQIQNLGPVRSDMAHASNRFTVPS